MDSVRKEIEEELKRTRLDKTRLYTLLMKIVENAGSVGSEGPRGVRGPPGPPGPQGPECECKCVTKAPTPAAKAPAKKTPTKKKVATASVV